MTITPNLTTTEAEVLKRMTYQSFQEKGILNAQGKLTPSAISNSTKLELRDEIRNPRVIEILTRDGSSMNNWKKFATPTIVANNGQRLRIHYYQNTLTGAIDYLTPDFKVKGIVKP